MLDIPQITSDGDQYRERLESYLETVLQCGVSLRDWGGQEKLPVFSRAPLPVS